MGLIVRFFIYSLWMVALLAMFASCSPKQPMDADPTQVPLDVLSGDTEPLDPEVNADPQANLAQLTDEERVILFGKNGLFFDLDQHNNDAVEHYFVYFTHTARSTFEKWLLRSEAYLPNIRKLFMENGLPQDLVLLPFAESGYNVRAYSRAGAAGLWQFMPYTGRKYGLKVDWWIDERRDPYLATEAAIRYLSDLHALFGDWYLALAAYNAGEGKISRALKLSGATTFFELVELNHTLPKKYRLKRETINYVPKFIAISKIFQNLEELGFIPVCWDKEPDLVHVQIPGGTDLLALAGAGDLKWSEFHDLNPCFKRQVSPPEHIAMAHFPAQCSESMVAYLNDPNSRPYAGYLTYTVRNGDSWWNISRKFGIPISVLKKVNNRKSNLLKPGQTVMIPGQDGKRPVQSASVGSSKPKSKPKATVVKGQKVYVVRPNDTLWDISRAFGISVSTLKQANGLSNSRTLQVGQQLVIPEASAANPAPKATASKAKPGGDPTTYTVRKGDSLWDIASRFGVSLSDLRAWNQMGKSSRIYPGQSLKLYQ